MIWAIIKRGLFCLIQKPNRFIRDLIAPFSSFQRLPLDNPLAIPRRLRLSSANERVLSLPAPSPPPIPPHSSVPFPFIVHPPSDRPSIIRVNKFHILSEPEPIPRIFRGNPRSHEFPRFPSEPVQAPHVSPDFPGFPPETTSPGFSRISPGNPLPRIFPDFPWKLLAPDFPIPPETPSPGFSPKITGLFPFLPLKV